MKRKPNRNLDRLLTTLIAAGLMATNSLSADDLITLTRDDLLIKKSQLLKVSEEGLSLTLEAKKGEKKLYPLFEIESPPVTGESYALIGEVAYRDVAKQGYLEMWNHLPFEKGGGTIGASFFSRTLAPSGPMKRLEGTEDWRPFLLPAYISDGSERKPLKLTINVNLPAGGTVELRNLQFRPSLDQRAAIPIPWITIAATFLITSLIFAIGITTFFWKRRRREQELVHMKTLDGV